MDQFFRLACINLDKRDLGPLGDDLNDVLVIHFFFKQAAVFLQLG